MHNYLKAEISAKAVRHNLRAIRQHVGPGVDLCAVVKCNCYGHGQDLLWSLVAEESACLGVATPAEALHLREIGYDGPMLVFFSACAQNGSEFLARTLDELLRKRITLTIAAEHEVDILSKATCRTDLDARVHVMVDTGMTRSGLLPADAMRLIPRLRSDPTIRMTGVYTHLATADEEDKSPALRQLDEFNRVLEHCRIGPGILVHAANSAATMDLPQSHYSMVRPGIAMYGYAPSETIVHRLDLRPSLRLTGHLMQCKAVPAGTKCGYGLTHEFSRDSRVGLVPVGYGDGYLRAFSNQATMRIRGRVVPVCGRVSMDQTVIDLTDVPEARVGDEVEIISNDPAAPNSMEHLASLAGALPYEIMCGLGRRVRRFLVE